MICLPKTVGRHPLNYGRILHSKREVSEHEAKSNRSGNSLAMTGPGNAALMKCTTHIEHIHLFISEFRLQTNEQE